MNLSQSKSIDHPIVLRISIAVFVGTEGVGDAFEGINNGTRKVVGWIYLPLRSKEKRLSAVKGSGSDDLNTQFDDDPLRCSDKSQGRGGYHWDRRM